MNKTLAALVLSAAPAFAGGESVTSGLETMGLPASGVQVAAVSDWFKSPAQKATDADKVEFLRSEGEPVEQSYFSENAGSIKLTDKGGAVFKRMEAVFNQQAGLLKSGYVKVEEKPGRTLQVVQSFANQHIQGLRESCKDFDRLTTNNPISISCGFITEVSYVTKSGRSYFASPVGVKLLESLQ